MDSKTYTPMCVFTFFHAHFLTLCVCVCVCVCVCQILYESSFEVVNANVAVLRSYILKCMSGGTVFPWGTGSLAWFRLRVSPLPYWISGCYVKGHYVLHLIRVKSDNSFHIVGTFYRAANLWHHYWKVIFKHYYYYYYYYYYYLYAGYLQLYTWNTPSFEGI